MKKRFSLIRIILTVMLASCTLAACGGDDVIDYEVDPGVDDEEEYEEYLLDPEEIIFITGSGDPASYHVFIMNPESCTFCELTSQWTDGYSYFNDPLPDESEYHSEVYPMDEDDWESLTEALNENEFSFLPEDLSTEGVMDGSFSYIQVKTADGVYLSGGSNVTAGNGSDRKKYSAILDVIWDVIHSSHANAPQTPAATEPAVSYEPVPQDYFYDLDTDLTLGDIEEEIGVHSRENTDFIDRYGWKCDDGSLAWVLFGGTDASVMSIQIEEDDCFTIAYDEWETLSELEGEVFFYMHKDEISEDSMALFEAIAEIIFDQIYNDHEGFNSSSDYIAVCDLGRPLWLDEIPEEYKDMGISARMETESLKEFYSEVFDVEREFELNGEIHELGIISSDDGYSYAGTLAGYGESSEVVSAATNHQCVILDINHLDMSGQKAGALRLVLRPTNGTYRYSVVDYEYFEFY